MNMQLCASGALLASVVVFLFAWIRLGKTMHSRDYLRWQLKTRQDVEKALANDYISLSAAQAVLKRAGISLEEFAGQPTTRSKMWKNRDLALAGWEATSLIFLLIVISFLGAVTSFVALVSGASLLSMLNWTWQGLILPLMGAIFIVALLVGFVLFSIKVFKTAWQMMKYG